MAKAAGLLPEALEGNLRTSGGVLGHRFSSAGCLAALPDTAGPRSTWSCSFSSLLPMGLPQGVGLVDVALEGPDL